MRISMYYPIIIAPPPHTEAFTGNFVAYALDGTPPDSPPDPPPPPPGQQYTSITVPVNTAFITNTSQVTSHPTMVAGTQTEVQTTTQRVTSAQTTDWNRSTLQTVMPDGEYVYRQTVDLNNPVQRLTEWTTNVIRNTTLTTGGTVRNTDVTTSWQSSGTKQTQRNTFKLTAAQSLSASVSQSASQSVSQSVSNSVSQSLSQSVSQSVPISQPSSQRNTSTMTTVETQTQWPTEYPATQRLTDVYYNEWPGVTNGVWRTTQADGEAVQTLVGVLQNTTATTEASWLSYGHQTWDSENNVMRQTSNGTNGTTGLGIPTSAITNTTIETVVDGPSPTQTHATRITMIPNGHLNTTVVKTVERQTTWPTSAV